jgi:hypothetical protein
LLLFLCSADVRANPLLPAAQVPSSKIVVSFALLKSCRNHHLFPLFLLQTYAPGGANPLLPPTQVPSSSTVINLALQKAVKLTMVLLLLCRPMHLAVPTRCCQPHKFPAAALSLAVP